MKHIILDTRESVKDFLAFLDEQSGFVAFDLETDSVSEVQANIYGVGLSLHSEEGYYIPIRNKNGEMFFGDKLTESLLRLLSNKLSGRKLIGHNIIYDVLVWKHSTGVDLTNNVHADTILMKHTVDEEPPFGLKEIAVLEFGEGADLAQQELYENIKLNGGSTTKTNMQMFKADTDVLGRYCCWDVMLTYKLFDLYSSRIENEGLLKFFYEDEVMPLYREVTIPMKMYGMQVDTDLLKQMSVSANTDIKLIEDELLTEIAPLVEEFEINLLNEEVPVKRTGNFPKAYARAIGLELTSVAKKTILALPSDSELLLNFKQWMLDEVSELILPVKDVQLQLFQTKFDRRSVFNISSKAHLKWLFFEKLGLDHLNETEKGQPQVDDEFLESIATEYPWVNKIRDLNTIHKMQGTYIDGILERSVDSKIYTSFLQFGTTSGRFASRNPNLQNAPSPQKTGSVVDKYVNCVRDSIIAPPGYKLIGSDFSSLEPHIAAYVSGDPDLIDIFVTGKDFYSAIAIKQFKLKGMSAFKDDANYLGNINKDLRNKTKTYSLAAFYGASGFRIAEVLKCEVKEATELLNGYLQAFPGIKKFIDKAHYDACNQGYVKTIFGRVRHLGRAKELLKIHGHELLDSKWARVRGLSEERSEFKNLLNNAVNFQIQGTAGHVMNRAMLLTARTFKEQGVDARIGMTIHDEQIIVVREDQVEIAAEIIKWAMENAVNLDPIKLKATPIIGNSYGECK